MISYPDRQSKIGPSMTALGSFHPSEAVAAVSSLSHKSQGRANTFSHEQVL